MTNNNIDPFAHGGRQDGDAEMFAEITAYWRLIEAANAASRADDEAETDRLSDKARLHRNKIEEYRPVTLAGVIAAFDFGTKVNSDPDYWPRGAIAGLRELLSTGKIGEVG